MFSLPPLKEDWVCPRLEWCSLPSDTGAVSAAALQVVVIAGPGHAAESQPPPATVPATAPKACSGNPAVLLSWLHGRPARRRPAPAPCNPTWEECRTVQTRRRVQRL